MLFISGTKNCYCPYRDCLGIDTSDGRVSWYQLLGVSQAASIDEMRFRYDRRRLLVLKNRKTTRHPVWDNLLDELDRAIAVLTNPARKREYDEDLLRRNRQSSMVRLPEKEADDWKAMMHAEKIRKAKRPKRSVKQPNGHARETYEPLRTVGEGPNGTRVYEAWEFRLNRRVAVRCLLKHARTIQRQQSFIEEAQFLASISHPNLVEVHTVNPQSCYMVTEFLDNTVVAYQEKQRNRQCSHDFVVKFLVHGLSVLKRLHEAGVIHGAIERRSFHLSDTGVVKLVDAPGCSMGGLFRTPRPDQTCVAPELLSPESFGEPGMSTDLYMLGFAAFELLAGDALGKWIPKLGTRSEADQPHWMHWHASPLERLPSIETLMPGIPAALATTIETLCEKQVADRFPTAADAVDALGSTDAEEQTTNQVASHSNSTSERTAKISRQVGGEAPLIHEARRINEPAVDLLEMIQNPTLFLQQFRAHRPFRLIVSSSLAAMFVVFLLAASRPTESGGSRTNERIAKQQNSDISWAPPSVASHLPDDDDGLSPDLKGTQVQDSKIHAVAIPTNLQQNAVDLEIAAIPISMELDAASPQARSSSDPDVALAIEKITPFPAVLARKDDFESLLRICRKLKTAETLHDKRKLFLQAKEIAPEDPRIWFLFVASTGFRTEYREELQTAIQLSGSRYSQPIRQMIESLIRDVAVEGASAADRALASLSVLSSEIKNRETELEKLYEWEWIGRVLGVLEIDASTNPEIAGLLSSAVAQIVSHADATGYAGIQRGRQFAIHVANNVSRSAVLPSRPQISFALCLESITNPQASQQTPSDAFQHSSSVARRTR